MDDGGGGLSVTFGHADTAHYEARRAADRRDEEKRDEYEHRKNRDGPAGLTDKTVNAFSSEVTGEEVRAFMQRQMEEGSLQRQFNVNHAIVGGLIGGLLGTLLGALQVQSGGKDIPDGVISDIMFGLLIGVCFGCTAVFAYQVFHIYFNKDKWFADKMDKKREALRRMEQDSFERHDEWVYYDAGREHNFCYRFLCCPHYGKITSERIIHSQRTRRVYKCTWEGVKSIFYSLYAKEVDSLDYDLVLDVGVEQRCDQFFTNTGTIVLHCIADADVSTIKSERDNLIAALELENPLACEQALRNALLTASGIAPLAKLVERASAVAKKLARQRREACAKEEIAFKPLYAHDDKVRATAKTVRVRDVRRPYLVLDDLSYHLSKALKIPEAREKILQRAAAEASLCAVEDFDDDDLESGGLEMPSSRKG